MTFGAVNFRIKIVINEKIPTIIKGGKNLDAFAFPVVTNIKITVPKINTNVTIALREPDNKTWLKNIPHNVNLE